MKIKTIQENFRMNIEDPFWNETFMENLPKWIHIWIVSISLISSIAFSFIYLTDFISKDIYLVRILAMVGIVSSLLLILNRDTFLPFLSENFIPSIFLDLKSRQPKKVEKSVEIKAEPGRKVIYWAADPGKDVQKTWKKGYNKFENSGVVVADKDGKAKIPVQCPTRYIVHGYKILPKHLHYRVYNESNQMLSRIHTVVLTDQCQ